MPVLSRVYGIVIRMLCVRALQARFHAIYGDQELVVGIGPLRILQGDAPQHVREMVLAWAAQHQSDLQAAWNRCASGLRPEPIQPLSVGE